MGAAGAERARAKVACVETEHKLVYDCRIVLIGKKSGQPLAGATVVVGADMPSMPMAHSVKPVTAKPAGRPGAYEARIELEMHGEWALKLDISGPTRDRVIHKMHFGAAGSDQGGHMTHGASGHTRPAEMGHGMKPEMNTDRSQ